MTISYQHSVGEAVAEDYRAAAIFQKYGIDFCCKGHTSIDEACSSKNIPTEAVMHELKMLDAESGQQYPDYQSWPLSQLVDHIEQKHHQYIVEKTPVILQFLQKLCQVHGRRHPELYEIHKEFNNAAGELAQHMKKEESILFPRVRKMLHEISTSDQSFSVSSGMLGQPIEVMMQEHDHEGERFRRISSLSNQYTPPSDACTTYRITYTMLQEFENDLHFHIHLENNILFPKAIEMERTIMGLKPIHV